MLVLARCNRLIKNAGLDDAKPPAANDESDNARATKGNAMILNDSN